MLTFQESPFPVFRFPVAWQTCDDTASKDGRFGYQKACGVLTEKNLSLIDIYRK